MITPTRKDTILKDLVARAITMHFSGSWEEGAAAFQIEKEVYKVILNQFATKGFIQLKPYVGGIFFLPVKALTHDYILAGGHIAEVEILELQLEKLKTEIYVFEKTMEHQKFEKWKSIVDSVTTFWTGLPIHK
ncbi:MAG: hypothetical protein JJE22_20400 [Bacteroidia bacterium]|nr:hypothetical protein [Bacteroidia bacterium]